MSDSGFVDEAPGPPRPPRPAPGAPGDAGDPDARPPGEPRARTRRSLRPLTAGFLVLVLAFVGLAGWAWSVRVHADDLAAYDALSASISEMDRLLTPQQHGEAPPCRDSEEGTVTRTYPESTGPAAAQMVGYLQEQGWRSQPPTPPAVAHLGRTLDGHAQTIELQASSIDQLVTGLTAHSAASAFGCLGR